MNLGYSKGIVVQLAAVFFSLCITATVFAGGKQEEDSQAVEDPADRETTETGPTDDRDHFSAAAIDNPLIVDRTAETITALDFDGNEVVLSKHPKRVIPNHTSMLGLWYLAGGTAVGRPDTRSGTGIPEGAMDLETTGSVVHPNTEKILALNPDFIILSNIDNHRNLQGILDDVGIENIILSYDNYSDFVYILDLFARLVGNREVVEEIVPDLHREVGSIIQKYADQPKIKFLSLFASTRSVSAELNSAHTAHIASMLGGVNIAEIDAPDRGQKRITLSLEHIVDRDPDVIFITPMGDMSEIEDKLKEDLMSNQAWAGLEAVREGRVHYLPAELFLYKPNDQFPEAFEFMAEVLYP